MNRVCYTVNTNTEITQLTAYLKKINIDVVNIHPAEKFYKMALSNKKDIFVGYKRFIHLCRTIQDYDSYVDMFTKKYYSNIYYMERPPFRFKQGIDVNTHITYGGILLSKISKFSNHSILRDFIKYTDDSLDKVKRFRDHWLTINEYKGKLKYKKPIIYIPLQRCNDDSIRLLGYRSYPADAMIKTVYEIFRRIYSDFTLIVRSHPDSRKYGGYDYVEIKDKRVLYTNNIPHVNLIVDSDIVISFNSGSLAEAVLNEKKVLYFSNLPTIDNCGIGYRLPSWDYTHINYLNNISNIVRDYIESEINQSLYYRYINFIIYKLSIFNNFHTEKEIIKALNEIFNLRSK